MLAMFVSHAPGAFFDHYEPVLCHLHDLVRISGARRQSWIATGENLAGEMTFVNLPTAGEVHPLASLPIQKKARRGAIRCVGFFHVVKRQRAIIQNPRANDERVHFHIRPGGSFLLATGKDEAERNRRCRPQPANADLH